MKLDQFEGLKAYTTEDGKIVTFRPDLNAQRMSDTTKRLEMPEFPADLQVQRITGQPISMSSLKSGRSMINREQTIMG